MDAILSIKPQFVEEIIAGRKGYEFRKKGFKRNVNTVFVYASSPKTPAYLSLPFSFQK